MPKRKTEEVDYLDTSTKRSRISIADLTERSPYTKPNNRDEERKDASQQTQTAAQDEPVGEEPEKVYVLVRKSSAKHWDEPEMAVEGVFKSEAVAEKALRNLCAYRCDEEPYWGPYIRSGTRHQKPGKPDRIWQCSFQNEELSNTEIWIEEHVYGDAAIEAEKSDSGGNETST